MSCERRDRDSLTSRPTYREYDSRRRRRRHQARRREQRRAGNGGTTAGNGGAGNGGATAGNGGAMPGNGGQKRVSSSETKQTGGGTNGGGVFQKFLDKRTHHTSEFWSGALKGGLHIPTDIITHTDTTPKQIQAETKIQPPEIRKFLRERKPPERLTYHTSTTTDPPPHIEPPKTLGEARRSPWWGGFENAIHT